MQKCYMPYCFMVNFYLAVAAPILSLPACTTENAYNSLRYYQEQDCQGMQKADRDDCMRRSGRSYDEYQQQMKKQEGQEK
jgi:hypothetical protein